MNGISERAFFDRFGLDAVEWVPALRPGAPDVGIFEMPGCRNTDGPPVLFSKDWRIESRIIPDERFQTVRYDIHTPRKKLSLVLQSDRHTTWVAERLIKEKTDIELPTVPEVQYEFRPTVNVIRKDDVNQSNIYLGHIGGLMSDPDYFALILMNRVLGSGFTSRLFRNIRSREGLAYAVYGNYSANFNYPGVFYVG